MKNVFALVLVALFTLSVNAQWGKKIKGNGKLVTIERSVGDYDAIAVAGWFDVNLVNGREGELSIKGEENLLEYIKTEVKNGKLTIKVKKGYNLQSANKKNGILVTVPIESINSVSLSGSGDIVSKDVLKAGEFSASISGSGDISLAIEADVLKTAISGSGDIELSGKARNFEVQVSGSGDVGAFDLTADHVTANVSGSADIRVTANESITARVSGSGDILYKGNPEKVNSKASGSGDINKA
ncbi:head GIN domain-containing protein [Lentiprolixibacter aurantiacus]|uniref:DUF2807 domain-containing protein n=1 Tax=Lentiprolixibacter aurantiacus TaxID=2993939 RepID=A0AAE3SNT6_9FLAO|nr:head GIN domain-containing protein [Lentiprolixibacter aurantiacus]MCX2719969.1 DUF2807 domain-containing protein [Lentiprolixibacter aurantiacus]